MAASDQRKRAGSGRDSGAGQTRRTSTPSPFRPVSGPVAGIRVGFGGPPLAAAGIPGP